MADPIILIDMFLRGLGAGALLLLGCVALRSGATRDQRIAIVLACVSIAAWLIVESASAWAAFGHLAILAALSWPVGALFWLLILAVFEDLRVTPLTLSPVAAQVVLGAVRDALPPPLGEASWWVMNGLSGVLALHACVVVARGWSGDLVEGRRRARALLLGVAALFTVSLVLAAFAAKIDPKGPWYAMGGGRPYGGGSISLIMFAATVVFLQLRPGVLGGVRRTSSGPDPRAEAAERALLEKLNAFMGDGGWRQEGLTIGRVAEAVGEPEHRLRRLINQRLGHRNFADFVNSYRIEAAKRRLADPAEARTTVAAIAFDLGYGSLGPFNRAFRAATGATPSEWRRGALAAASPELQEAV